MKVALPVEQNCENTSICISFGRAPFYMVYDTNIKSYEFIENTAASSAGGAGIKASQILVNHKINVVITERCGQNAADVLLAGEIKIYKAKIGTALENIKLFEQGELGELSEIHAGFHGHGNK